MLLPRSPFEAVTPCTARRHVMMKKKKKENFIVIADRLMETNGWVAVAKNTEVATNWAGYKSHLKF